MSVSEIIRLLGGVALFLFGMNFMGDGLKQLSGDKLEPILYKLSGTRLRGVLLGTGVTAVIQSSCATSVMAVGFVNSGMMKVRQAISVILGAILGTSITGWVICLSYIEGTGALSGLVSTATLTSVVAVAAILMRTLTSREQVRHISDILMGFAVLMFGMSVMSGAVGGLGEQAWFRDTLSSMTNPLLGFLVGAAFTAVLQSASAAVGILQALSVTGVMSVGEALPLLMGVTVGASAPVLLSALGANTDGKRTAFSYLAASLAGTLVCAIPFYLLNSFLHFGFMERTVDPFSMAFVNSVLRFVMVVLLFPFTDVLERFMVRLFPDKAEEEEEDEGLQLEERFIQHPALAIAQSRLTIAEMAETVRKALESAFGLLFQYDEAVFTEVEDMEAAVDRYEDVLGSYLIKVSSLPLSKKQNEDLYLLLHAITDLERISDHAYNIAQNAQEIHEKGICLTEAVSREMEVMHGALREVMDTALQALLEDDTQAAMKVEPLEELIDNLCDEMKHRHTDRLQKGVYTLQNSFVFNDLIGNYERVSDHCSNIAVAVIELEHESFDTHNYIDSLMNRKDEAFEHYYRAYQAKYCFD